MNIPFFSHRRDAKAAEQDIFLVAAKNKHKKIPRLLAVKFYSLDNFSDFWMRDFFDEQGRTRFLAFGVQGVR